MPRRRAVAPGAGGGRSGASGICQHLNACLCNGRTFDLLCTVTWSSLATHLQPGLDDVSLGVDRVGRGAACGPVESARHVPGAWHVRWQLQSLGAVWNVARSLGAAEGGSRGGGRRGAPELTGNVAVSAAKLDTADSAKVVAGLSPLCNPGAHTPKRTARQPHNETETDIWGWTG